MGEITRSSFQALMGQWFFHLARGELGKRSSSWRMSFTSWTRHRADTAARSTGNSNCRRRPSLYIVGQPIAALIIWSKRLLSSPCWVRAGDFVYPYDLRHVMSGPTCPRRFFILGYPRSGSARVFDRRSPRPRVLAHPESVALRDARRLAAFYQERPRYAGRSGIGRDPDCAQRTNTTCRTFFKKDGCLQSWALGAARTGRM